MKNTSFAIIMCLAILGSCQKPNQSSSASNPHNIRTWEEVLLKAEKYGIADSFRIESENNGLMLFTEKGLDEYFESQKKAYEKKRQFFQYLEEGKKVRCLSDYFKVLDSFEERRLRQYVSEENYAAVKKEYFASDYKFFINEEVSGKFAVPFLTVVTKPDEMPTWKARQIDNR